MNQDTLTHGFLYLDVNGLLLFTKTTQRVLQFPFSPDVIRDMEVINRDLLGKQFSEFLRSNNITQSRYIVVLSQNLLFEKTFQKLSDQTKQQEIGEFLECVPFEHPATIIFENAVSKIIASNRDFYEAFIEVLLSQKSDVELITSAEVLGIDVNQALSLTPQALTELFKKAPSLRNYGFQLDGRLISTGQVVHFSPQKALHETRLPFQKRLYVLVGILFLLLFTLVGVFIFNYVS